MRFILIKQEKPLSSISKYVLGLLIRSELELSKLV